MPKNINQIKLNIDLLKPQSEPQKIPVRLLKWILSAGRYLIVFVEIVVLAAFVSRFKLDNDITETGEEIEGKIPFLQSLKEDEDLIRKFKFQITTISDLKSKRPQLADILDKIAAQTPSGITLSNITFDNTLGNVSIKITGVAQNNDQLATLVYGLRQDATFQGVNLANIGLEQGLINFSINCEVAGKGNKL